MKVKVVVSHRATIEIYQAVDWYNEQKAGMGKRFYSKLNALVRMIKKNPLAFGKKYGEFHAAPMEVFPYIVFYFIPEKGVIVIAAVFHTSRDPEKLPEEE